MDYVTDAKGIFSNMPYYWRIYDKKHAQKMTLKHFFAFLNIDEMVK